MEGGNGKKNFVVAGHEALFEAPMPSREIATDGPRCDACGEPIDPEHDDDAGYAIGGRGRYLWARGDERRIEDAPLCPTCAAAIGIAALHQWGMEEEEG